MVQDAARTFAVIVLKLEQRVAHKYQPGPQLLTNIILVSKTLESLQVLNVHTVQTMALVLRRTD